MLLLPFAYAMFFAFPFADDFGRALLANGLFDWRGGLQDVGRHWLLWSGRYTHHFLVVFLGDAVMTRTGYGAVCLGVFSLYGFALFGIFSQIAAGARLQERVFFTLVSLVALAAGHSALNITFYVVTDALGLGIGNAMVLMFIFALCRIWHLPVLRGRDIAFAIFSSVFAIGCYEHAAIAAFVAAALATWMAYRCGHPHRRAYLLVAGVTGFFLLVSFLAPGNFNRKRIRDVTWNRVAEQLLLAGQDWSTIALGALYSHFALLALFLGLAVTPRARGDVRAIARAELAAAGVLAFVALSAGIVVVHALSDVRVIDTPKLPASIHLLLGTVLAYMLVACAGKLRNRAGRAPAIVLVLPLMLVFAVSANTLATVRSIFTGQLDSYAAGMAQRQAVLGATRNADVVLAPLNVCPFPSCPGEPVPASSSIWPANYIAGLYEQRSVVTAAPDASRAYAAVPAYPAMSWTRIPGSEFDVAYAAVDPGPNATYQDIWVFVHASRSLPAPSVSVITEPQRAWAWIRKPRLQPIKPENPANASESTALYGAPLRLGDPTEVSAVSVSFDGANYHRLSKARP
ncbi:MAG TPA: hypothetical protein VMJ14_07575 [Burkholderiales bacterium]|nr:hypothetical protein [Burkholderiales bacterium]